jgi:hypothetical protein
MVTIMVTTMVQISTRCDGSNYGVIMMMIVTVRWVGPAVVVLVTVLEVSY